MCFRLLPRAHHLHTHTHFVVLRLLDRIHVGIDKFETATEMPFRTRWLTHIRIHNSLVAIARSIFVAQCLKTPNDDLHGI